MSIRLKRLIRILLSAALVLGMMSGMRLTAYAEATPVTYLDWDEGTQSFVEKSVETYNEVSSSNEDIRWNSGWYVVPEGQTINTKDITCLGDIHLILCDGATLQCNDFICDVDPSHSYSLTIYAQSIGEQAGTMKVNGDDYGILGNNSSITINGGKIIVTGEKYAICAMREGEKGNANITIRGGKIEATSTGNNSAGIYVSNDNIAITGGEVTATGEKYGIEASNINIIGGEVTATGKSGAIDGVTKNTIPGTGWTDTEGTAGEDTIAVNSTGQDLSDAGFKKVQFSPIAEYKLWVGNERVTSVNASNITGGETVTASYDAENNKLTLNNASITGLKTNNASIYYSGADNLTIEVTGENTIGGSYVSEGIMSEKASLTFLGDGTIDVTGTQYGILAKDITISKGTVTATAIGENSYGIGVGDAGSVNINGGVVTAIGKGQGIVGTVKNAISGIGWTDTAGTQGEAEIEPSSAGQDLHDYNKVQFREIVKYDIWVGGDQVTENNLAGEGWSYDAEKKILTLDNYSYEGEGHKWTDGSDHECYAAIYAGQDLTIKIENTNTVKNNRTDGYYNYGIYVEGDLSVTGTGNLTTTSSIDSIYVYNGDLTIGDGIYEAIGNHSGIRTVHSSDVNKGTITINGGTVNASGSGNAGIDTAGKLVIKDGNVTATGKYKGIISYDDIMIDGTVNASGDNYGIYASIGNVTISDGTVNAYCGSNGDGIISYQGNITINGGKVTASADTGDNAYGIRVKRDVTINGGEVTATGIYGGIASSGGSVTIEDGDVEATGTGNDSSGIFSSGNDVVIKGGKTVAVGNKLGIDGLVKNSITGTGWTDTEGTTGKTAIGLSDESGQTLTYKRVKFPGHTHSFTYSASGATITATCANTDGDCPLDDGTAQLKKAVSLIIKAPTLTTFGETGTEISEEARLDGLDEFTEATKLDISPDSIKYYKATKSGSTYTKTGNALSAAPTDAGEYVAEITVTVVENQVGTDYIASVGYTIAKADPTATAPTATATYDQTLADVTLTNPTGNTAGTWAWADATTTSVGDVGSKTFKANFKPTDTTNYNSKNNVDVTITVGKADNPATVTGTASVTAGGNTVDLADNVTLNGATGDVSYVISGEANGCSMKGSVLTSGNSAGTVTVNVTVATDANYNALAATPITVTINEKQTQTITADDVTVTFGDTGKTITATTDGGGDLSYAVKSGDAVTVDASTGALTIVKAGNAVITVTAAETATYAQATKDVNITVNQVNSSGKVTAVSGLVYDGTAKALVDSNVHGGIFIYRLGTDGEWTEEIPEAADFGTYTVYYYIKGDGNHKDNGSETEPMGSVDVTIKCPYSNEWVDGKWYNKDGSQTYKPLGSWKKDGKDWMYADSSGWYAKNRWQKIDFKWYFFDKEGHMLKDAYQKDASGKIWYLGKNGAWDEKAAVIGWKQDSKGWWFGLYGKEYLKSAWKMINGNWYYFKSDGYIAMNEFVQGWWLNKAGAWKDPVKYSWHKSGSKWWYGTKDGWYAKSKSYTIDGKKYTFDKKGYTK